MVVQPKAPVQPLQHQLDGVDVPVREVLVGAEKVFQEGDVLAQAGLLAEGKGGVRLRFPLAAHIPHLGLQGIDAVLAAHQVDEASAQVGAEINELMLRVQADGGLPGLQDAAQQEFQEIALALAGVAQDEGAGGGLVLCPPVQIHDDVGAVAVPPSVESVGIGLAGVVEGV